MLLHGGYKFAEIKEGRTLSFFRLTNGIMINFAEKNSPIISQIWNINNQVSKWMVMPSCLNGHVSYLEIKVNKNWGYKIQNVIINIKAVRECK